jgi:hypothetical protein
VTAFFLKKEEKIASPTFQILGEVPLDPLPVPLDGQGSVVRRQLGRLRQEARNGDGNMVGRTLDRCYDHYFLLFLPFLCENIRVFLEKPIL